MKQILIVAKREFLVRAKTKSTIISLLVMIAFIVAGGVAVKYFGLAEAQVRAIGLTGQTQPYAAVFSSDLSELTSGPSALPDRFETKDYPDEVTLEQAVKDGDIELGLGGTVDAPIIISDGSPSPTLTLAVQSGFANFKATQYLNSVGADIRDFSSAVDLSVIKTRDVSIEEGVVSAADFNLTAYLGNIVMLLVLFMFIIASGNLVAMGVVEEKTSRVVEVLISTVSARRLLTGKILGIGLLGFLEMLLVGGVGIGVFWYTGLAKMLDINLGEYSGWLITWFLIGLATYLVLYAGAGALVSRQEEVAQAVMPLTFLGVGGVYAAMFLFYMPNGLPLRVISMIPFLNCYAMPTRHMVSTEMQWWEPWLSLGINLAVLPLLIWAGARLYRRGVLATSGKIRLREAWQVSGD